MFKKFRPALGGLSSKLYAVYMTVCLMLGTYVLTMAVPSLAAAASDPGVEKLKNLAKTPPKTDWYDKFSSLIAWFVGNLKMAILVLGFIMVLFGLFSWVANSRNTSRSNEGLATAKKGVLVIGIILVVGSVIGMVADAPTS
jgi:hypothetical protein